MFDVYDEYIEVMQPKMIHIGHDEWRMPLDVCPHCAGKNYFDLFAEDVNKIYDYMAGKGIKVAICGIDAPRALPRLERTAGRSVIKIAP